MLELKFCFIILMEKKTWEINGILDENIEIAEQTLIQIKKQGEQITNSEETVNNIQYLSTHGEKILNRMSSFFYRIFYKPQEINFRDINPKEEEFEEIKWENNNFYQKMEKLKQLGLEIGENLDKQNKDLENLGIKVDNNSVSINKNIKKIKNIMG